MTELDSRSLACARSLANRLEFDETIIRLNIFSVCILYGCICKQRRNHETFRTTLTTSNSLQWAPGTSFFCRYLKKKCFCAKSTIYTPQSSMYYFPFTAAAGNRNAFNEKAHAELDVSIQMNKTKSAILTTLNEKYVC